MRTKRPWRIGVVPGKDAFPKEEVRTHELRLSQAANLSDLAKDYQFFTPALLYLYVRMMGRDPLPDFIEEYGTDVVPLSLKFDRAIFTGLTARKNPVWNYYLYGMEKPHFEAYQSWLGTTSFIDRGMDYVARVRTRDLRISDPLYLDKIVTMPEEVPLVSILAFCLDTNKGCYWIEEGAHPVMDLPAAKYWARVYKDTWLFAQSLFGESNNPYGFVEDNLAEEGVTIEEKEIRERVRIARIEEQHE